MAEKYLVVRGSGGLSNRLQAVAGGIAYCLLTGRALVVDWRDGLYSNDFANVFPRYFDLAGLEAADAPPAGGSVHPAFWEPWLAEPVAVEYLFDNDHLRPENYARTSIDVTRLDYPQDTVVAWAPDLRLVSALAPLLAGRFPEYAGCDAGTLFRRLMLRHCPPREDIARDVAAFAEARFRPGATIGVHIRHTDLKSPLEAFVAALRALPDRERSVLFLATDNRFVARSLARLFPGLVATEKFFPPDGSPLHSYFPGVDNERKGREALVDMLLLARCHRIIHYAPSSFARVPILLAGLPADRVTAIP